MHFPLSKIPHADWTGGGRNFGARREGGKRKHAGCDLLAPVGTPIFAVADGVIENFHSFYDHTYFIHVDHGDFEVRYGEVLPKLPPGLKIGSAVTAREHIGWVGFLKDYSKKSGRIQSMLHFEMYSGMADGQLTNHHDPRGFVRRADLIDPTSHLNTWARRLHHRQTSRQIGGTR